MNGRLLWQWFNLSESLSQRLFDIVVCCLQLVWSFFLLFYPFFFSYEVSSAFFHQRSLFFSRKFKLAVKRQIPALAAICPLLHSPYLFICVMPLNTHKGVCVCLSECSLMGPSCSSRCWLFSCCWVWCWCGGSGLCAVQWYVCMSPRLKLYKFNIYSGKKKGNTLQ